MPRRAAPSLRTVLLTVFIMTLPLPLASQELPLQADRWNRAAMEWLNLLRSGDFEAAGARADPAVPWWSTRPTISWTSPSSPARAQLDSLVAEVDRAQRGEMEPDEQILGVRRGYWQELEELDPRAAAQELTIPTLVLQGGRDYQSTEEDFQLWQGALGEKEWVTMKLYPALNHLFATGTGKATPEEYASEVKHVDPEVIRDLARWILEGHLLIP